jgi:hypothetical protein
VAHGWGAQAGVDRCGQDRCGQVWAGQVWTGVWRTGVAHGCGARGARGARGAQVWRGQVQGCSLYAGAARMQVRGWGVGGQGCTIRHTTGTVWRMTYGMLFESYGAHTGLVRWGNPLEMIVCRMAYGSCGVWCNAASSTLSTHVLWTQRILKTDNMLFRHYNILPRRCQHPKADDCGACNCTVHCG